MAAPVKPIPDGYHSITAYLALNDAAAAIDWYKKALGAEEIVNMPGPDGKIMHAELKFGDSIVMMGNEHPQGDGKSPKSAGTTTVGLHYYVTNVDAAFDRAVKAGAKVTMPPTKMFWGDRYARLIDPFGHSWSFATHIEDVPPEEMPARARKAFEEMCKGQE